MYISKFQISNFMSFYESAEIELKRGFNVVIGKNNSGKSAVLEALSLNFIRKPHRSLKSLPDFNSPEPLNLSSVSITFGVSRNELLENLQNMSEFILPYPHACSMIVDNSPEKRDAFFHQYINNCLSKTEMKLSVRIQTDSNRAVVHSTYPSLDLYEAIIHNSSSRLSVAATISDGKIYSRSPPVFRDEHESDVGIKIARSFLQRIYRFKAERPNIGECKAGSNYILSPDCKNLPEVLHLLQPNKAQYERYNKLVREVLPHVQWVSVKTVGNKTEEVEILIWNHSPETERIDLAIPLKESGTGIGQVLSILYVVMMSQQPMTIIIDEPQSFLHPGAIKKLIEILKTNYNHHQYIISTHSPEFLFSSEPATLTTVTHNGETSDLTGIAPENITQLRKQFIDLGLRPRDVFGTDYIIIVEGETEEKCFPKIIQSLVHHQPEGIKFRKLKHTSDISTDRVRGTVDTYLQLSQVLSLLPLSIVFFIDDENRKEDEKQKIAAEVNRLKAEISYPIDGSQLLYFLPRMMYENYLLNPIAIANQLNKYLSENKVTPIDVEEWITNNKNNIRYWKNTDEDNRSMTRIDGAKLLTDLFSSMSGDIKQEYKKTKDSVEITEWLIQNAPQEIEELAEFLCTILAPLK